MILTLKVAHQMGIPCEIALTDNNQRRLAPTPPPIKTYGKSMSLSIILISSQKVLSYRFRSQAQGLEHQQDIE